MANVLVCAVLISIAVAGLSPYQLFEEYNDQTSEYMKGGPNSKSHLAAAMAAFDQLVPWLVSQEKAPPGLDPLDFASNVLAFHQTEEHVRAVLPLVRYALKGVADKCAADAAAYMQICQDAYGVLCGSLQQVGETVEAAACVAEYNAPRPKVRHFLNAAHTHRQLPRLRAQPWWEEADVPFPFLGVVRDNFEAIRAEVMSVTAPPFSGWGLLLDLRLGTNADWDPRTAWESVILNAQGKWDDKGCELLPVTCAVLRSDAQLAVLFPSPPHFKQLLTEQERDAHTEVPTLGVKLYRVRANSGIKPHSGSPGRLVCSMTLLGPTEPSATITVANITKDWREGEFLCFDDSFVHAVNNPHPTTDRLVLAFVIVHPDLLDGSHREL
jgi:hypothetical protein